MLKVETVVTRDMSAPVGVGEISLELVRTLEVILGVVIRVRLSCGHPHQCRGRQY